MEKVLLAVTSGSCGSFDTGKQGSFLFGLKILSIVIEYVVETVNYNTYVASIYAYNTRKRLHIKKRFNSHKTGLEHVPTWPPFHCFLFVFVSLAHYYFLSQTSCENAQYI